MIICSESGKLGSIGNFVEAAEDTKLIGQVKNIDEHNVRRNAKNILQHKKSDEGIKLINMLSTHGFVEIRLKRFRDEGIKKRKVYFQKKG